MVSENGQHLTNEELVKSALHKLEGIEAWRLPIKQKKKVELVLRELEELKDELEGT